MDAFMNSKFMIGLQTFGQKLGANKYMSSLQASMMGIMSVIMCGSVFQIICAILSMFGVAADTVLYAVLYTPYNYTMNLVGIYVLLSLAFNYAKAVGCKSPLLTTLEALACFLLIACYDGSATLTALNVTYLGSQGMFPGFIVAFVVVQVDYFCQVKNIKIPMPDVCPPSLVNAMAAIIPSVLNVGIWLALSVAATAASGMNICALIMFILGYPLAVLVSVPGMFVLGAFACFMWFFGIHGTMLLVSVLMAPMIEVAATNAAIWQECVAAGMTTLECHQALVFSPVALFAAIAICGGTGNTLPLCIFGLRAKSEQIKAVSKIGIVPGWFGINEPVTFGMPVMYNPIMFIPYLLNVLLVMACTLIAYKVGFIYPGHVYIGSLMPMGFAQFLGTFRWQNALWDYICLIPAGLVWYPFFKVYDNQLYAREQAALAEEEAEA